MKPTKGRIIHFVLANGETRPGIVTNAWPSNAQPARCNLTVHLDGMNDLQTPRSAGDSLPASLGSYDTIPGMCKPELIPPGAASLYPGSLCVGSAAQDEESKAPGTWHWPPRES